MRGCSWKYLLLAFSFPLSVVAQGFSWWNDTHQWDGNTHWSSYLIVSPAFMGPNAFPIPFAERKNTKNELDLNFNNHFNSGEKNWDFLTRFSYPLGEKASLRLSMNPIEYFEMDSTIRDERIARDESPKGYASGDLLVEMNALLFENKHSELLFNIGLKTASGSQFRNARYTDSPAYYFDLSFHHEKIISPDFKVDAGLLMGLYVWQTYMINNRQNDAILAAATLRLHYKDYCLQNDLRGFKGYLNNGDQPLLYSIKLLRSWNSVQVSISQQYTLHDYPYNSLSLGINYRF